MWLRLQLLDSIIYLMAGYARRAQEWMKLVRTVRERNQVLKNFSSKKTFEMRFLGVASKISPIVPPHGMGRSWNSLSMVSFDSGPHSELRNCWAFASAVDIW